MYNVSSNFKNYIKMPSRTLSSRLVISSNTYTDSEIVDMNLESNLVPGKEFTLGCTVCNKFEATVMTTTPILTLNVVKPYIGLDINGVVEEVPLGVFTIDDAKVTKSNAKVVAYDNMVKFEKAYFSNLTYPATIQTVATEICQKAGVSFSSSLANISIGKIEGKTLREAIGIIAGVCGGFARINRLGALEIVTLTTTDVSITTENFFGSIEKADKNFAIRKITAIKEDNTALTSGSGLSSEEITFSNNYITKDQLDSIFATYNNYSYRPLKFNWQGNPAIDVGDKITITDIDNTVYTIPVMRLKLTYQGGLKSEISSVAKGDSKSEYDYKGPVSKKMDRMLIEQANIKIALIEKATIDDLTASNAKIKTLESEAANINNILAGNLGVGTTQTINLTAKNVTMEDAFIKELIASKIKVSDLLASDISTNRFRIVSDSGKMLISDNTIQIKDTSKVRVQIGKDASNDYNMYVWDATGNLMFDATGLKASGIKDKIIRNDMVSDTANIDGSKIEKESLVVQINGATTTLKASKIKLDTENQTLDLAFTSLKSTVTNQGNTISSQGTVISDIQGKISTKVWQQDITTAVNAIQVGIRNLLLNSDLRNGTSSWGGSNGSAISKLTTAPSGSTFPTGVTSCIQNIIASGQTTGYTTQAVALLPNTQYTASFWVCIPSSVPAGKATISAWYVNGSWYGIGSIAITERGQWVRKSYTFTTNSTYTTTIIGVGIANDIAGDISYSALGKLELGNKPTDFTPAPEDVQTQIDTTYTQITQTATAIGFDLNTQSFTDAGLNKRLSVTETFISLNKDKITAAVSQTDVSNYVTSRSQNLVSNGTGSIGNNTNFRSFIYDGSDSYYSKGSFKANIYNGVYYTDEFISVDLTKTYKLSVWAKTNPHVAGAHAYIGIACHDSDNNLISPDHTMYLSNTTTTLAQDLKNGDTVVYLTSAANWNNAVGASITYQRKLIFWDYRNAGGYQYPVATYSRHISIADLWADGSINYSNNTITLRAPWTGGLVTAGTSVSQGSSGGGYKYIAASNVDIPTDWTNYTGIISGVIASGNNAFHPGTASVKIVFLLNRDVAGNTTWLSNISFGIDNASQKDLDSAITRISTAESTISQLSSSISLKVDTTTYNSKMSSLDSSISSLTSRMNSAELKITSDAIVSTVRSSAAYTNDLGAKVSTLNLSSEIQQRAGAVQVAFNNITSNIQNAGGIFSIVNGKLVVKNGNSEVVIDGQYNMHKIIASGYMNCYLGAGYGDRQFDIAHNMGYKPCFALYMDADGGGYANQFPIIRMRDLNNMLLGGVFRAGSNNSVIHVTFSRDNTTAMVAENITIRYYIYKEVAI